MYNNVVSHAQSVKNLVFLAKVLHRMELAGLLETSEDGDNSRHDIVGSTDHQSRLSDQADLTVHQSDQPDQPGQSDQPDQSDQSDQRDQPDQCDQSDQPGQSDHELTLVECEGRLTLGDQEADETTATRRRQHVRDLHWLIGRLSRLAKYEAGHHPKEPLKVRERERVSKDWSLGMKRERVSKSFFREREGERICGAICQPGFLPSCYCKLWTGL